MNCDRQHSIVLISNAHIPISEGIPRLSHKVTRYLDSYIGQVDIAVEHFGR